MFDFEYDAFISHASEDKLDFVEPLALELKKLGLVVWYDRFTLRVGDSLHDSIELGLSTSRYGVVVLSHAFFAKNWPRNELSGLFARETKGQKVILPIWHQLSHEDVVKVLPIMADRFALQSSDGVKSVAEKLVKITRPELLAVQMSSDAAALAGQRLSEAVEREHPGYEVRVTTGQTISVLGPGLKLEGLVASLFHGGTRTDILVSDPAKLKQPPRVELNFSSAGLEKFKEGVKTGKAQSFISGEFHFAGSSIPLMPSAELIDGGQFQLTRNIDHFPELDVRLEVDTESGIASIPVMKLRVLRAGTEEIEFELYHVAEPFKMQFISGLTPGFQPPDFNLSASFPPFDFKRIDRCVKFISGLMAGGELRIFNLTTDAVFLRANLQPQPEWIATGLATLIESMALIERYLRVSIPWSSEFPDKEIEKIHILYCLISGEEFGTNLNLTAMCPRTSHLILQAQHWKDSQFGPLFIESTDRDKISDLFGTPIFVPSWGLYTEQAAPVDIAAVVNAVKTTPEGGLVAISMCSLSSTFIRLKSQRGATAVTVEGGN